jgi:hypothetical protein
MLYVIKLYGWEEPEIFLVEAVDKITAVDMVTEKTGYDLYEEIDAYAIDPLLPIVQIM